MSLKSKIEAVIYASEEPVTLQQLVGLLAGEAQGELDEMAANQAALPLEQVESDSLSGGLRDVVEAGTHGLPEDAAETDSAEQHAIQDGSLTQRDTAGETRLTEAEEPGPVPPNDGHSADAQEKTETGEAVPPAAETVPSEEDKRRTRERDRAVRDHIRWTIDQLIRDYAENDRGIEIREVASGFRMGTKPEFHDAVRGFVKSLKPALKLTLPALETLAVVAYKQPVTAAEISEIRGVDSAGVLGGLMSRKLIATAGRKQVIGRPMLYKTTRDFLLRFGLKDVSELPSMEEFERMAGELAEQEDLPMEDTEQLIEEANARGDAEHIRDANAAGDEANGSGTSTDDAGAEAGEDTHETTRQNATAETAAGGIDETAEQQDDRPGNEHHTGEEASGDQAPGGSSLDENRSETEEEHAR